MKPIRSVFALLVLVHVLWCAQAVASALSTSHRQAAARMVELLDARRTIITTIEAISPPHARGIVRQLLEHEVALWQPLKADLVTVYMETFSEAEIEKLIAFFKTDVGRKWIATQPQISVRLVSLAEKDSSSVRKLSEIGCVSGILAPAIAQYKERAGITGNEIPPNLIQQMEPIITEIKRTCSCVMDKAIQKWGIENLLSVQREPGFQAFARGLLESGECPLPGVRYD